MKRVIAEAWQSFERTAIPAAACRIQRQEMRRAFFVGAWSVFRAIRAKTDAGTPDEVGMALLDDIGRECRRFFVGVLAGQDAPAG